MKPGIEQVQAVANILRLAICCHGNETHALLWICPIVHTWRALPTISPSYIWVRAVVWECSEGQTDTQTVVTSIHFALAMPHTKCNNEVLCYVKTCCVFCIAAGTLQVHDICGWATRKSSWRVYRHSLVKSRKKFVVAMLDLHSIRLIVM